MPLRGEAGGGPQLQLLEGLSARLRIQARSQRQTMVQSQRPQGAYHPGSHLDHLPPAVSRNLIFMAVRVWKCLSLNMGSRASTRIYILYRICREGAWFVAHAQSLRPTGENATLKISFPFIFSSRRMRSRFRGRLEGRINAQEELQDDAIFFKRESVRGPRRSRVS